MDEFFDLGGITFEWDREKADTNSKVHNGIKFELAATAFNDSSSVQFSDEEHSENEIREILIGYCIDGRLLRVSFTERPPNLRLFSARLANSFDETRYENGY